MKHEIIFSRRVKNLGHNNSAALVRRAIETTLAAEGVEEPCTVSVTFTDDEGIREINRQFRNVDRPTDVLSFPMNELVPGAFDAAGCERDPETGGILLGDVVISVPRCDEQGREFGHGYDREVSYLTTHSVLHLLGYDHMDDGPMKKQMRSREKTIMGDNE